MSGNKFIWPILTALAAAGNSVTEAAVPVSPSAAFPTTSAAGELTSADANAYAFASKLIAEQKYTAAAAILGGLVSSGTLPAAADDYLHVLEQLKDYQEIVRYYENKSAYPFTGKNYFIIGSAYAQLGDWQEAHSLFTKSTAAGYADAKLKAARDLDTAIILAYKEGRTAEIPPLQDKLAKVLNADGKPEQALTLLEPRIADNTASPSTRVTYISSLYTAGNHQAVLSEALRLWPRRDDMPPDVQLAVAGANKRLNRIAEASAGYQALLDHQPENLAAKAGKGYTLLYTGKTSDGMALYEQAITLGPTLVSIAAQDAAALIENKQIVAGRLLYEKIVALYPDNIEYGRRYTEMLYANNLPRLAEQVHAKTLGMADVSAGETRQAMHDRAVVLARSQKFAQSLALFKTLYTSDPSDRKVVFDYITVLTWSGNLDGAIELYESFSQADIPEYVLRNIAGAYYQTGQYVKALEHYQPLAATGDRQAKIKVAEIQYKLGNTQAADRLFAEMLVEKPMDFEVLVARGSFYAGLGEHRLALRDYEKASQIVSAVSQDAVRDLHDKLAAAYINLGQNKQAIDLLKNYINTNSANLSMQGNYILSLRSSGQYRLAIAEGKRIWPEYGRAPVFGLRALAECHVQLKELPKAIEIYNHILSRLPTHVDARFGLGFSMMMEGKFTQGLSVYDSLISENPERRTIVANEADFMMSAERFLPGQTLYNHLLSRFPDDTTLRLRYAGILTRNHLNRAAFKQYQLLAQFPEGEYQGLIGQVKTALLLDDRREARRAYDALAAKYGRSAAVNALSVVYADRPKFDLYARYAYNSSYKQLESHDWQLSIEEALNDRYSVSAYENIIWLKDLNPPETIINNLSVRYYGATIYATGIGLRYADMYDNISVRLSPAIIDNSYNLFSVSAERRLSDRTTLTFSYNYDFVRDVQALAAPGGPIFSGTYRIRLGRELSANENYSIALTKSYYSDQNQSTGFSLEYDKLLYDRSDRALSRFYYWDRNFFKMERDLYDSPSWRESFGIGWVLRHSLKRSYWEYRVNANWAHDYPESAKFEPYFRVEYGRNYSPLHAMTIGAEYGLRSNNAAGSGLNYSYRQFDAVYRIRW